MHFDARAAKLLPPGGHLLVLGCPGLRLEASVSRKTWTYRYKTRNKSLKQVAIGHWPAMPVLEAVTRWQQLRDGRDSGVDPVEQRKAKKLHLEPKTYTVADVVQDFIDGHLNESREPKGALAARRLLYSVLEQHPDFAETPADSVNRSMAFEVLDSRKGTPTAAAKLRSLLGSAWDYALDAGRLDGNTPNWWRQLMLGKLKSKGKIVGGVHVGTQRRVLQPDEVAFLFGWLHNMHTLGRDTTVMYLWTCARGVEILGMRPENVKEEKDGWWWTVPVAKTKNAHVSEAVDLRVPLFGAALEVVLRRMESVGRAGWLFEKAPGEPYEQKDFSTYINSLFAGSSKAKRRQGEGLILPMANWSPHNLRRTSRTMLASLGCIDEIGEAIVGHLPKGITGVYNAHTYDVERREWLRKLSDRLSTLSTPAVGGG